MASNGISMPTFINSSAAAIESKFYSISSKNDATRMKRKLRDNTESPMHTENSSGTPSTLQRKRSSNLSSISERTVSQSARRKRRKPLLSRLLRGMICFRGSSGKTPKTPRGGHRTVFFDDGSTMPVFIPTEGGPGLTSTLTSAKKATAKGRNHTGKVEFYHELPIDIVLHITQFLELELTQRRNFSEQNGSSHGNGAATTSPVFHQIFGVFRPWNIYRLIFPNVCLDMTVFNKRQDLRCLVRYSSRLRIIGGSVKAEIVRELLLKSQLESIAIMLSEKGAKNILKLGGMLPHEIASPISNPAVHAHVYADEISDTTSSASHTGSSASRLAVRSKALHKWSMDGSTVFKRAIEEGIMLFPSVMLLHAQQFENLTSFSAEECPNLNGIQIQTLIEALVELRCPLKHFAVSPSNNDVSISICHYLGIESWELETLRFVVTEATHTHMLTPESTSTHVSQCPEASEFVDWLHVDSKDVAALLFPMRNSLRELYCNLDSPSLSFVFDSTSYPRLRTVSLGKTYYDDELHTHFLQNRVLHHLAMDVRDTLVLRMLKNVPSLQVLRLKNTQVDLSIVKTLVEIESQLQIHTLQFTHHSLSHDLCQLLFKIKSLRDLKLKDRILSKKLLEED